MPAAPRIVRVLVLLALVTAAAPGFRVVAASDHLVVSEVVTGGTSASDELIEIYNPTTAALPLEGLEVVYVSASGATVTRRAAWEAGATPLGPGAHLLVANELGIYAAIADATYASGMAATGGSVALRIQGAASAIDAVGWGTAAGAWHEGVPAPAPPAGSSLERLPGGPLGSTTDTDDNASDFAVRSVPDPRNRGSAPVPDPAGTPAPTPAPSPTPGPTPSPVTDIDLARGLPDGTAVTVEGTAFTASGFTEGGGYVADATGAVAVLADGTSFERGDRVRLTGAVDDRYAQRTLRVGASGLTILGTGAEPAPLATSTGSIGEALEARLVRIGGQVVGGATELSGGVAYDVDDGSGPVRVLLGAATGVPTAGWVVGAPVEVVGVVGQRDSSGTGAAGYRVMPRDAADVSLGALPDPTPTPAPTPPPMSSPTPTPDVPGHVSTVAAARAAPKNARLTVRGVVTLGSGVVNDETAVIQDATGAILLRLADEAGGLRSGRLVEVAGVRSTKSGMESLRVTTPPRDLGIGAGPEPLVMRTGGATEAHEAALVVVRGALLASARRSSSGSVTLDLDDGSGALRVHIGAGAAVTTDALVDGAWVEVTGVLGQETTGALPLRGYRVWPRGAADVRVIAPASGDGDAHGGSSGTGGDGGGGAAGMTLGALARADLAQLRIGATLVARAWPELGVSGLLWDGERLVAISTASEAVLAAGVGERPVPLPLELGGLRRVGTVPGLPLELVELGSQSGEVVADRGSVAAPVGGIPPTRRDPAWVSVVGRLSSVGGRLTLTVGGLELLLDARCAEGVRGTDGTVRVTGILLDSPRRLIVGCHGVAAAPSLAIAASRQARGQVDRAATASAQVGAASAGNRSLALALLLVALATALGGLAGRRGWADGGTSVDLGDGPASAPEVSGPRLTLSPRSREHDS